MCFKSLIIITVFALFGNVREGKAFNSIEACKSITSEIVLTEKMYTNTYYDNGNLKAEGWSFMEHKTDYWIFYHRNGKVASKGHFPK